mmetsp:Transcript_31016/g.50404  ORF Transcript_31016/g.50404 Transcript_31016/m.50404 type:complete len:249 (+) Transcript_31016:104-850(+)
MSGGDDFDLNLDDIDDFQASSSQEKKKGGTEKSDEKLDVDVDALLSSMSDDDEEESETIVDELRKIWLNEKGAPEILKYEARVMKRVEEELETQKAHIERLSEEKHTGGIIRILQMEYDRVNYMRKDYLRIRLRKIQKFDIDILSSDDVENLLNKAEIDFASGYLDLRERHFGKSFLHHIPDNYDSLTEKNMEVKPNMDEYVFFKATANVGTVNLGESGDAEINEGDIVVASYGHIKDILSSGMVHLI